MSRQHQSTSWQVLDRQARQIHLAGALRLQARRSGWLAVQGAQVWLTRNGGGNDHVLGGGEQFWLRSGEGVVIEPWQAGEARVQRPDACPDAPPDTRPDARPVLREEHPGAGAVAEAWRGLATVLRSVAGRLLAAARSAEAMANAG
jgi:Protein of unknown function (DUF2917)